MIQLRPLDKADMPTAESLYTQSFPPEERRPWLQIADTASMPLLYGIYVGDTTFAGIITVWNFDKYAYVEHFAVDPSSRGGGIGAKALSALRRKLGIPVVLEVEPPEHPDPMAPRRIAFYQRCGFTLLDYPYIQPSYAPGLPSVPLCLMTTDPTLDPTDITATLHTRVYGLRVTDSDNV